MTTDPDPDDFEERIAGVLKAHDWYFVGNLGIPGLPDQKCYNCSCGWRVDTTDGWNHDNDPHIHVAAALVAELGLTE